MRSPARRTAGPTLVALERANLFLVPLDDRRRWYRYHHLFADVLRAHLLDEQADEVPALHGRASGWFERSGEPAEAIRHALAAGDFDRAANLAEIAIRAMAQARQEATMRGWLKVLPAEVIRVRPVLDRGLCRGALARRRVRGRRAAAARRRGVVGAARKRGTTGGDGRRRRGGVSQPARHDRRVPVGAGTDPRRSAPAPWPTPAARSSFSPAEDHLIRAAAAGILGLAYWASGDLDGGFEAYAECVDGLRRVGHIADIFGCSIALADIRRAQGRLRDAMRIYERALQLGNEPGGPVVRGTADMYVGMSELSASATTSRRRPSCWDRSRELGEHVGMPQNRYRSLVAMARIREAEGDVAAAVGLLDEAERVYVGDFFPDVRPVAAVRARSYLLCGALGDALVWARERGLSVQDDLSYMREFEHVTLARILLAVHRAERSEASLQDGVRLLDRLLADAEAGAGPERSSRSWCCRRSRVRRSETCRQHLCPSSVQSG